MTDHQMTQQSNNSEQNNTKLEQKSEQDLLSSLIIVFYIYFNTLMPLRVVNLVRFSAPI
jgi:hypothetical protein